MSLKEWFSQRSGQSLLQDIRQIATSLKKLEQHAAKQFGASTESNVTPAIDPADVLKRWDPEEDDYFLNTYNKAPWAFPHVQQEYSESVLFHRKKMGWHFSGTISGKSRDEIDGMTICGDAGSDAFLSGQKMTLLAFARWIGHSHPHYLLGKSDAQKEFDWTRARRDLEEHLDDEAKQMQSDIDNDSGDARAKSRLERFVALRCEIAENLSCTQYDSGQDFAEAIRNAIYAAGRDDEFGLNEAMSEALSEALWGYDYSPQAYARWRQARYFALWLEEREARSEL